MHAKNRVVVSKIWITGYWLWSRLSYIATASNQRRIVEIQLLASVGWKWGCQPFSCPCSLNVMHCRKERHVCLRNPFPLFLFGFRSLQSLPEAGFWEPQYVPPGLHYACIMPIPSLQLKIKTSLTQRSKGFGHGVVVSKICYVIYSDCVQDLDYRILIVLSGVTRGCCKPMNNCRDWAFRNIGLEEWLPAFQLLIFEYTSINAEKRYVRNVCLGNPCLLWYQSLHSPTEAWGPWEPQYAPPVLHSCCIMPTPSLQLQKKDQSHAEKQRVWSRSCGLQELLQYTDCSSMTAAKEGFSLRGLEAGLPAFQLLMFSKCDWKEMWGMLICLRIHPPKFPICFFAKPFNYIMKRSESL